MFKWFGKVPEWLNGAFSKNVVSLKNTEGSNPSFSANSANKNKNTSLGRNLRYLLNRTLFGLENTRGWWSSIVITSLSGGFFLIISSPKLFVNIEYFNQRWFGLSVLIAALLFIWFTSSWARWSRWHSFCIWFQASTLLIFSFVYFLRLNQNQISIGGLNLNTSIIFIPLTLLIFTVSFLLYTQPKLPNIVLLAVVGLYFLQGFSIVYFVNNDRTGLREFTQDWLSRISEINPIIVISIISVVIGFTSVINLNLNKTRLNIWAICIFTLSMLAVIISIQGLPFTYWYKTLLALVAWDFLYRPFKQVFSTVTDSKFSDKLAISVIYHGILTIIIIVAGFISNL